MPAIRPPVNEAVPVMAVQTAPTDGELPTAPIASAPEQEIETPVDESVPATPVAVNAVSPEVSHVTAPAAAARTAQREVSAVNSTTMRAILLMMISRSRRGRWGAAGPPPRARSPLQSAQ